MTSTPAAFGYQFLFIYLDVRGREIFALLGMKRDRDKLFEKMPEQVRKLRRQAVSEIRQEKRRQWKEENDKKMHPVQK